MTNTTTPTKTQTVSENYLTTISGLSAKERDELALYYRKLPESQKIEIEPLIALIAKQQHHKLQKEKSAEFWYAIRMRAIKVYFSKEQNFKRKEDMTSQNLADLTAIRIRSIKAQLKKPKTKSSLIDIIRVRYEEIKYLRGEMSWRQVAEYLRQYTATKIHYTYLRDCYTAIEKELGEYDENGKSPKSSK